MSFIKKIVLPAAVGFGFVVIMLVAALPVVTTKQYLLPRVAASIIAWPMADGSSRYRIDNSLRAIVLIQSFSLDGSLMARGHGIVMTEDGLVVVPRFTIPRNASYYQVVFDDRVARATVVAADLKNGLVLLSIDERSLTPAHIDPEADEGDGPLISVVKNFTFGIMTVDLDFFTQEESRHGAKVSRGSGSILLNNAGNIIGLFDAQQGIVRNRNAIINLFATYVRKNDK